MTAEHNQQAGQRDVQQQAAQLEVDETPEGALALNVEGRSTQEQYEGFGQLWEKTYTLRLTGIDVSPAEVVTVLRERLPDFQPPENSVFPSPNGVKAGEVLIINAKTPGGPVSTGMLVLESDDTHFTLATPEGHPEAGRISFSAHTQDGETVAQIQSVARASDPLYEIGLRLFGAKMQENIWQHVLRALASHYGITAPDIRTEKHLRDRRLQWSRAGNIRHNATILTVIYVVTAPVRRLFGRDTRDKRDGADE